MLICGKQLFAQNIEEQKAMWIIDNFIPNTEWTKEPSMKEFKIGLLAPSPELYRALINRSRTTKIKGLKLKIIEFNSTSDIEYTQVLYVGPTFNGKIKSILSQIHKGSLLITDQLNNPNAYMINFLDLATRKKKYEINPDMLTSGGLKINPNMFLHGGKTDDLKAFYQQLKRQSVIEQQQINSVSRKLARTTENLQKLKEKNTKAREENRKQTEINQQHKLEILQRQDDILELEDQLNTTKHAINSQANQLEGNKQVLQDKQLEIQNSKQEIQQRRAKIEEQNALIEKKKKEIKTKDLTIDEQKNLMRFQRIVLIVFFILFLIGIVLAILVWRGYKAKRTVNKKLQTINEEISKQKEEISNQQKQTDMLNGELERLSIVASETGNAVTIMDSEGNFEWVNVGFTKLYGYTLQLLTHEIDDNILGVSSHPDMEDIFEKCKSSKKTQVYESKNQTRSESYVWVQTSLTPITDQEGNISKFITIETDITNIKETEQTIRKQHSKVLEQTQELEKSNSELERLSLVARETENAIAIMDSVGDFQWINEGYSRLFGYSYNELIMEYSKNIITKDTDSQTKELIRKCIEEKTPVNFERLQKHADGHEIWVKTTLSPTTNYRNHVANLISISTDISKIKKAEQFIIKKNEELIKQQEEIVLQKDTIDHQNSHINSSILYAKTIQNAILPPDTLLNQVFDTFLIYKPLDVVSGDFYWNTVLYSEESKSNIIIYAVVDCTGHGVPGAFMSMIGSSLLDEIVNEKKIYNPSTILENMNTEIQSMLRQESAINDDSMDVCLCSIEQLPDSNQAKVVFAGAKRPLYFYSQEDSILTRIKGTRKSIGGIKSIRNKEEFENQEVFLDKGDILYLTTDGLVNQPSSTFDKFGTTRFNNLIKEIGSEDLNTQKQIIEQKLAEHVGDSDLRDDICFMAVRI